MPDDKVNGNHLIFNYLISNIRRYQPLSKPTGPNNRKGTVLVCKIYVCTFAVDT